MHLGKATKDNPCDWALPHVRDAENLLAPGFNARPSGESVDGRHLSFYKTLFFAFLECVFLLLL